MYILSVSSIIPHFQFITNLTPFAIIRLHWHWPSSNWDYLSPVLMQHPLSCSLVLLSCFHAFLHAVARAFFLKLRADHTESENSHCPLGKLDFLCMAFRVHSWLSSADLSSVTSVLSTPPPSTPNSYPNYFSFQSPEYVCSLNVVFPPLKPYYTDSIPVGCFLPIQPVGSCLFF